ncbi:AAA family ATPase [Methylomonas sp. MED-D]|uniref:AAA family ATPase n=1 Tax=Methylomonas sp. MED-D TaxID=3418768 RepID=UPI003D051AC4
MLRFGKIDVSGEGPFDSGQSLSFSDGLTLIAGGNGTGKTTIANALRRKFECSDNSSDIRDIADWLIFLDDYVDTPCGGAPWRQLALLISSHHQSLIAPKSFEDDLTSNIREMLRVKVGSGFNKFSTRVTSVEQLRATIANDGAAFVTAVNGEDISASFQAMGERLVLYLSINASVRKLLRLDVPFVVDSQLGCLDQSLLHSCYKFISEISKQTIILESNYVVERLGEKPQLLISYHPHTNCSTIETVV